MRPLIVALLVLVSLPTFAEEAPRQVPQSQADVQLSFAPVVKDVIPSVVNVYATFVNQQTFVSPFENDPFFSQFFGSDNPLFGGGRPQESRDLGSGVVVDASGVILTNSHVVHNAADIRISMSDGREYAVDLVLDDSKDDLAVLRIRDPKGRTFPALTFGDSDSLQVGDLVLAIGNPFGVGQTVTSGIVSAIARTSIDGGESRFFIQTDAAINPGNSGGALVDMSGRLVGINTAIFSRSGGSLGIGFAIPSNMARLVADAGIGGKPIERAWFGARLQPLTTELADSLGLEAPRGAMVTDVAKGGPAETAGLKSGDVVVAIGDRPVGDPQEFAYRYAMQAIGGDVVLSVVRGGKPGPVTIALVSAAGLEGAKVTIDGDTRFAGATGEELTPAFADELGLDYDANGVVIADVASGSPADMMGLRRGDIILNLQGKDIRTVDDFKTIASGRTRAWQITLMRGGQVIRSMVEG